VKSRTGRTGKARWRLSLAISAAVAALLGLAPVTARAVSPAAEALFQDGRRLMAAGRTAEACARFTESYTQEASSGTLLNLALCHQTEGKTATAWAEYRTAARLARGQGREDRARAAEEKVAALEPKLARLTLTARAPVPGLTVASEAGSLDEGGLGVAMPIDPGVHALKANAPGHRPWTARLEIKEAEQRTLEIPPLEEEPKPLPAPAAPPTAEATVLVGQPPGKSTWRESFDLYAAAGGGLLLVGGTVLYGIAYTKFDSAKDACNQSPGCSASERSDRVSTIDTLQYLGIGSWIAGGALVVVSGLHHWFGKRMPPLTAAIDPWNETVSIRAVF
jgi:tetratricopeptide (TPR) repeat protein